MNIPALRYPSPAPAASPWTCSCGHCLQLVRDEAGRRGTLHAIVICQARLVRVSKTCRFLRPSYVIGRTRQKTGPGWPSACSSPACESSFACGFLRRGFSQCALGFRTGTQEGSKGMGADLKGATRVPAAIAAVSYCSSHHISHSSDPLAARSRYSLSCSAQALSLHSHLPNHLLPHPPPHSLANTASKSQPPTLPAPYSALCFPGIQERGAWLESPLDPDVPAGRR
jgi:hypothetical protein